MTYDNTQVSSLKSQVSSLKKNKKINIVDIYLNFLYICHLIYSV